MYTRVYLSNIYLYNIGIINSYVKWPRFAALSLSLSLPLFLSVSLSLSFSFTQSFTSSGKRKRVSSRGPRSLIVDVIVEREDTFQKFPPHLRSSPRSLVPSPAALDRSIWRSVARCGASDKRRSEEESFSALLRFAVMLRETVKRNS